MGVVGIHTLASCMSIVDELSGEHSAASDDELGRLQEDFERRRGTWSPFWEALLSSDPAFFAAYANYSSHPIERGQLPPMLRELMVFAMNATTTKLFVKGVRGHGGAAMRLGATRETLIQVLELVSLVGVGSSTSAALILSEG